MSNYLRTGSWQRWLIPWPSHNFNLLGIFYFLLLHPRLRSNADNAAVTFWFICRRNEAPSGGSRWPEGCWADSHLIWGVYGLNKYVLWIGACASVTLIFTNLGRLPGSFSLVLSMFLSLFMSLHHFSFCWPVWNTHGFVWYCLVVSWAIPVMNHASVAIGDDQELAHSWLSCIIISGSSWMSLWNAPLECCACI